MSTKWDPRLKDLLLAIEGARTEPCRTRNDAIFLKNLLQDADAHRLFSIQRIISDKRKVPVLSNSMEVLLDVFEVVLPRLSHCPEYRNLLHILQNPHLQAVLFAHDSVAQKDYLPHLPEVTDDWDDGEDAFKIVQLVKSNEPLGATIKKDEVTGKIVMARVMRGGAADRSGLIHVGDEVAEVNGVSVEGKTPDDVLAILQNSENTLTFKLRPSTSHMGFREGRVRMRAHFDYDPSHDVFIPCREAGLAFSKGDVLHVVNQDDPYWWQARMEGERNTRAGLIPSRQLQEQRIIMERRLQMKNEEDEEAECDDFDREDIPTYEEVVKMYPRPSTPRPIVLCGAPGVGRNELKRRLIALDKDKFRTPVPFTSRPARTGEINGKEYNFVSRDQMEMDICDDLFIEFGEYKGNLYGTSMESVRNIIEKGMVCLLTPHYQALKMMREAEFKPFVVYIKPPPFDVLKQSRSTSFARSTFDENNAREFTDDEFRDMIQRGKRIEFMYGHFFDEVIVNDDLSVAFEKLLDVVKRVETTPQWVPAAWS